MNQPYGVLKKLRIQALKEEVPGFKTIVFEEGHNIAYQAGQYLTLVQDETHTQVRRSYSITSSPALNEPLSIGVKRIPNGLFSRHLTDQAQPGDAVVTTGSGGLFVLPKDMEKYQQLFFFAAGSGITPIYALLKTTLHLYPHISAILVYSNTSVESTIFLTELQGLQQQFPQRFHIEFLFSNSFNLLRARLHRNLILEFLNRFAIPKKERLRFYICGPENYMRLCTYTLQEHGFDADNIKKENFIIHTAPKRDTAPADKEDHLARIRMGNEIKEVTVSYPDSILAAAKKAGLILPYSCEAGRCGNCVAQCIKGNVWHSYNEVLTQKELQSGLVLTCVAHPVGGDVDLVL